VIAIVIAAFLFQPFRDWTQARLDRFFYRDRFNYRRTLMEFGRALTNEVHLEPMLVSVMDRISQTLLVDRLALFQEDAPDSGRFRLARSMGLHVTEAAAASMDLSFLSPASRRWRAAICSYESARAAREENASVRQRSNSWT
jgi:two-component system NtrC family sensor kinase